MCFWQICCKFLIKTTWWDGALFQQRFKCCCMLQVWQTARRAMLQLNCHIICRIRSRCGIWNLMPDVIGWCLWWLSCTRYENAQDTTKSAIDITLFFLRTVSIYSTAVQRTHQQSGSDHLKLSGSPLSSMQTHSSYNCHGLSAKIQRYMYLSEPMFLVPHTYWNRAFFSRCKSTIIRRNGAWWSWRFVQLTS